MCAGKTDHDEETGGRQPTAHDPPASGSRGAIGAHGRAGQLDAVGGVDEAIEDGLGDGRIVEVAMPVGDRDLTGDDGRGSAVAVVKDLDQVS